MRGGRANKPAVHTVDDQRRVGLATSLRMKALDDFAWNGARFQLRRVGRIAPGPDARFLAFDSDRAADKQPMFDIEARAAECDNLGSEFDVVAKPGRRNETGAGIDQRQRVDTE